MYDVRSRYLSDTVATVSPAKLLTMLYDRLHLDVQRAEVALREGNGVEATQQLGHAQDIVAELISSLDTDAWDGAAGLMSIYTFLLSELIETSMTGDPERAAACHAIISPLRDAWHGAAASLTQPVLPTQRAHEVTASAGLGVLGVG